MPSFKLSVLLVFAAAFAGVAVAQTNGKRATASTPFATGEVLSYEGKISKIIRGIAVADLTLTVTNAPNSGDYLVKGEGRSKGTLLKLFRFSFLQQIESTISENEFRALKTVKHDVQKERVRDSEALFDYMDKTVTYIEVDPKDPMRAPRKIASGIEDITHDLVSGIYALRLLPLAVGNTFEMNVSDSGLVYKIPVKITARELQKTIFGKVWCFRVEPEVFGRGRLIDREGSMTIWITDDIKRLPIRSVVQSPAGKIEIKLKSAKNIKS
jgi:hypothetical protein